MLIRSIAAVITAATGERVVVGEQELRHALLKHFPWLPRSIFLELLEQVLRDPSEVYTDNTKAPKEYRVFYRVENRNYIVAIVKITKDGAFFTSMYLTGNNIRNPHKGLKKVKI
ncbi:MAG: hypothetical protein HQK54_17570 [Oligoflexales bacterium]|nr:hypothetical protein [Oligoflexales bacterium]